MKAQFIADVSSNGFNGVAHVFKVDPPIEDYGGKAYDTVLVSSVSWAMDTGEPECFIFPWDTDSKQVASWGELRGSTRGAYMPRALLEELGYEVTMEVTE